MPGIKADPGIDDLRRVLADIADRDDTAILDCNIGAYRVVPEPVDYCCSADHEVMHPNLLPCLSSIEDVRFALAQPDPSAIMPPWMRQSA